MDYTESEYRAYKAMRLEAMREDLLWLQQERYNAVQTIRETAYAQCTLGVEGIPLLPVTALVHLLSVTLEVCLDKRIRALELELGAQTFEQKLMDAKHRSRPPGYDESRRTRQVPPRGGRG